MTKYKDEEIVFLYIKDFEYKDAQDEVAMGGHPKVGRVYRAFKNPESNNYKLHIGAENNPSNLDGLFIRNLKSNNKNWKCNIVEITAENYFDLGIKTEDAQKLAEWDKEDNRSLIEIREAVEGDEIEDEIETEESSSIPMIQLDEKGTKELLNLISGMSHQEVESTYDFSSWPEFADAITEVMEYLNSTFSDKYAKADISTKGIILSKDNGKGFNCGNSLKYISRYCTEGYSKSNNVLDLYKAIHYLLFEITRRNVNEQ